MKSSLEQVTADSWRDNNPADLPERVAADAATLATADIRLLSANCFVQRLRQLVSSGRTLGHTWLYAPLRGTTRMTIGGQRWTVSPREVALVPAGVHHEAVALAKRFEVVTCHLCVCMKGGIPDQPLFRKPVVRLPDPAAWHRQLKLIVSMDHESSQMQSGVPILRFLLMDLVMHGEVLTPARTDIDPRVARAINLLQTLPEHGMSLPDIRTQVGLGHSHFNRLFREVTGVSPRTYQKGVRLRGVMSLLRDPGLTVKEIAARLGYFDTQHMEREFKAEFGMPPGAFRKDARRFRRKNSSV